MTRTSQVAVIGGGRPDLSDVNRTGGQAAAGVMVSSFPMAASTDGSTR